MDPTLETLQTELFMAYSNFRQTATRLDPDQGDQPEMLGRAKGDDEVTTAVESREIAPNYHKAWSEQ